MTREASVATLRRLAEAVDAYGKEMRVFEGSYMSPDTSFSKVSKALAAYRSEIAPLRTREQVDADVVATVRSAAQNAETGVGFTNSVLLHLIRLCREETSSGPSSADAEEVPSPRPPASPAGADYSMRPWRCQLHGASGYGPIGCPMCNSGPPGAAAAKESRDNTAAPEGATIERDCNCDQALGLEQKLADIRTERSLYLEGKKSAVDALAAIGLILREP